MYNRQYYTERSGMPESKSWFMETIRPGDMGCALAYSLGATDYAQALSWLKEDLQTYDKSKLQGRMFGKYIERLHKNATRAPGIVLDVGCGRGEFSVAMYELGNVCIGIDVSPVMSQLCIETIISRVKSGDEKYKQLTPGKGGMLPVFVNCEFENVPHDLWQIGIPKTVVFCESIEHISQEGFRKGLEYLAPYLATNHSMIVITNWIDYHPIPKSGFDHIQEVNEELYDYIAGFGNTIFRKGSHLVVQL